MEKVRFAWMATHPIQYQAPLLREIASLQDIDLTAIFFSDFSVREFTDKEFGKPITWDTPLLEGYKHIFLSSLDGGIEEIKTFQPFIFGLRKLLTKRNFDAVLVQGWNHYGMVLAAWLAKRAGLKVLLRCEATDHVASSTGLKGWIRERLIQFLLEQVDFCMAIGTNNRNFYINRGVPFEKIGFMPYCVDNQFFQLESERSDLNYLRNLLGLDSNRPVLLYASKFIHRKHPDILLDAYSSLDEPRPYLLYVGDGELAAELKSKAKELGLDEVRFLGFKNQSELPKYYALADIFILPSINETWGLVINEAMNAGCAIITIDSVGSSIDLVRNEINGIVLPIIDKDYLVGALNKCLEQKRYIGMGKESIGIIQGWGIQENIVGFKKALGIVN